MNAGSNIFRDLISFVLLPFSFKAVYHALGEAYQSTGDFRESERWLRTAVEHVQQHVEPKRQQQYSKRQQQKRTAASGGGQPTRSDQVAAHLTYARFLAKNVSGTAIFPIFKTRPSVPFVFSRSSIDLFITRPVRPPQRHATQVFKGRPFLPSLVFVCRHVIENVELSQRIYVHQTVFEWKLNCMFSFLYHPCRPAVTTRPSNSFARPSSWPQPTQPSTCSPVSYDTILLTRCEPARKSIAGQNWTHLRA